MKKVLSVLFAVLVSFSLFACGQKSVKGVEGDLATLAEESNTNENGLEEDETKESETEEIDELKSEIFKNSEKGPFEIAFIVGNGVINDEAYNQGAWEGVVNYSIENEKTRKYYIPEENAIEAYMDTIKLAVEDGAKIIICNGEEFAEAIYSAQDEYPQTNFVLLDAEPHNNDKSDYKINQNTMVATYQEGDAGFLAGYAAVKDGNLNFGVLVDKDYEAGNKYALGFVQGVDVAAKELEVECSVHYGYNDSSAEVEDKVLSWCDDGARVLFACGDEALDKAIYCAEQKNIYEGLDVMKVIGVNVDKYSKSELVMTSAIKNFSESSYQSILMYYSDNFKGGEKVLFDVINNGIGIAMEHNRFNAFTQTDYSIAYENLRGGEYKNDNTLLNTSGLRLTNTKVIND